MSNSYNLDEVNDQVGPTIIIDKNEYILNYPTMEDLERIQNEKDSTKQNDIMFSFIKPKDSSSKLFKDIIKGKSILVLQKLGDIIKKEFGIEEV